MSLGLFIGSLIVLAIGLVMGAIGYYMGHISNEEDIDLNCCQNPFKDYLSGNRETCNDKIRDVGIGLGIRIGSGIFIIVGFIASIIFGTRLVIDTRKRNRELKNTHDY